MNVWPSEEHFHNHTPNRQVLLHVSGKNKESDRKTTMGCFRREGMNGV